MMWHRALGRLQLPEPLPYAHTGTGQLESRLPLRILTRPRPAHAEGLRRRTDDQQLELRWELARSG